MKLLEGNNFKVIPENERDTNILKKFIKDNGMIYGEVLYGKNYAETFYFYKKAGNNYILTRGLFSQLKEYLENTNIKFTLIKEYKDNKPLILESKIKKLRFFQEELTISLEEENNGFVIVPTGGGKTIVMINEIIKRKARTIVMINNKNLLYQFKERILSFSNIKEDQVGIYGDGKKDTTQDVLLVLVQSFTKLKADEIKNITSTYDLFFLDETHHIVANTLSYVVENINCKYLYGLTATPNKKDGVVMEILIKTLGPLLYSIGEDELQKQGIIHKPFFIPIINNDSNVLDFFRSRYKLIEGRKEKRYYAYQFLNNNIPFNEKYLLKDGTTTILCQDTKELKIFVEKIPSNIKSFAYIHKGALSKYQEEKINNYDVVIALDDNPDTKKIDNVKLKNNLYYNNGRVKEIYKVLGEELKEKDNYILVISDTIEHLNYLYDNLPEKIKNISVLFHGGIKKKEKTIEEEKILNKEYRIIFAIDKFVGEGWDVPFLNVLVLTSILKDSEKLKQIAGRVMRQYDGKKSCKIYDIVDINNPITLSQFKKRFFNYYTKQTKYNNNNKDLKEIISKRF